MRHGQDAWFIQTPMRLNYRDDRLRFGIWPPRHIGRDAEGPLDSGFFRMGRRFGVNLILRLSVVAPATTSVPWPKWVVPRTYHC